MSTDLSRTDTTTDFAEQQAKRFQGILAYAEQLEVTADTLNDVNVILHEVKKAAKTLDAERHKITDPLEASKKAAIALFKPALDAATKVETVLKGKVGTYYLAQERAQQATLEKASEAFAQGDQTSGMAAIMSVQEAPKAEGTSVRKVLKFEITAELCVPNDFWSPDPVKIQRAIDAGVRSIPGVRIYEDTIVSVRTK